MNSSRIFIRFLAVVSLAMVVTFVTKIAIAGNAGAAVEFTLVDHHGNLISAQSLHGKPALLFFGFTRCPEICPTTLLEISNTLVDLGEDADRLHVMFVTLDPERDTIGHLAGYLSAFDRRILGLTGQAAQIDRLAKALGVVYERVAQKEGYTFNHSVFSFLLDRAGRPNGHLLIGHGAPRAIAVKRLKTIISEDEPASALTDAGRKVPR